MNFIEWLKHLYFWFLAFPSFNEDQHFFGSSIPKPNKDGSYPVYGIEKCHICGRKRVEEYDKEDLEVYEILNSEDFAGALEKIHKLEESKDKECTEE